MGQCSCRCPDVNHVEAGCRNHQIILDGITLGTIGRTDAHDPAVVEVDNEIHKEDGETAS